MTVVPTFTSSARRFGIVAAVGTLLLGVVYSVTLVAGLLSLRSPQQPIGDPIFSALEILILLMMPFIVALMVAVHSWAPAETRAFSLMALAFASLLAGLTCGVHFVILVLSHQAEFSRLAWMSLFLSFRWPSVAYALDILAWDVFFAISMFCATPVFSGDRLQISIRVLMIASGVLALAGLSGIVVGDMRFRMIGVVGYAGLFPIVALLLAILFFRARATSSGDEEHEQVQNLAN